MDEMAEPDDGRSTSRNRRIVRPERVPARAVWPSEATDFTPWLAANLDFLDDLELGRLSLVGVEVQLPGLGRSLDILADTADGRRVAIENQYSRVDHDHLTRGLAYAVGHGARALVIVAEEHRPEFVAVADYLNRCQEALGEEHGIAIFLVTLSVERIGEAYIPRFAVLSQPNAWLAAVAVSESGRLASADDFLSACDKTVQSAAAQVLHRWQDVAGSSTRYGKASVSLNLRNPLKAGSGTTSVFVLYTDGQVTLNRGYLLEGGMVPDAVVELLDEKVRQLFPSARWGEKGYYLTTRPPPDPEAIIALGQWTQLQTARLASTTEGGASGAGCIEALDKRTETN